MKLEENNYRIYDVFEERFVGNRHGSENTLKPH